MRFSSITERLAGLGSDKWRLHLTARAMKASGTPIIELTIGEPDLKPDPALLTECSRSMNAGRTGYSNGRGEPSIIKALVAKYQKRRADVTEANILCFPGTQTALFSVMMGLVEAGHGVLVGDPLYATYEGVIAASGAHAVKVPLRAKNGFHMQAEDLEAAVTPDCRVLLLNTPHNPTGAVLTADEIAAIGDVCRRHDLWILSDEVYEELIFAQNAFASPQNTFASPFDNPDLSERTIVVSSISKSHAAPGFRSGWAVGPVEFANRLLPLSETMLFGVQPFIADMTAMAVSGDFDTSSRMRQMYQARAVIVHDGLSGVAGLSVMMPEAGMFILVDVAGTGSSGEGFAWALLRQKHVAVMPGTSFGKEAGNFIRISLTVPDEALKMAIQRIVDLVGDMAHERELENARRNAG